MHRSAGSKTSWSSPAEPAATGANRSRHAWSGFVASSQRRRIFVNANRIAELDSDGARLRSWDVDLNPFKPRSGEVLIGAELIDRKIGDETVSDIALREHTGSRSSYWVIDRVRLARKSTLRRRPSYRLVDYDEVPALFDAPTEMQAEAARLRDFHPAEVAAVVRALPVDQRRQLAEAMDDERLADVLEELPEEEQVRIVAELDLDRLVGVFDEMEYDDLADLIGEMAPADQERMLSVMDADDADVVRRLLEYEEGTAGGLMTPEVIILGPTATVSEALAQIRDPDWVVSIATQVFVCQAPFRPPTGKFLGVAHVQRLLREPPSTELGRLRRRRSHAGADRHRPPRRGTARQLRPAGDGRLRRSRPPARRGDRRRRHRPTARRRLADPLAAGPRHPRGDAMRRREDLTAPRAARRVGVQYDSDRFGAFSESIARNLGTAQFLVWQTVVIALWIVHNAFAPDEYQFDPWSRGLVLLTLVLSLQASYAAPLILLAQNRQEFRDRSDRGDRPQRRRTDPGRHRVPRPRDRQRAAVVVRHGDGRDARRTTRRTTRPVDRRDRTAE